MQREADERTQRSEHAELALKYIIPSLDIDQRSSAVSQSTKVVTCLALASSAMECVANVLDSNYGWSVVPAWATVAAGAAGIYTVKKAGEAVVSSVRNSKRKIEDVSEEEPQAAAEMPAAAAEEELPSSPKRARVSLEDEDEVKPRRRTPRRLSRSRAAAMEEEEPEEKPKEVEQEDEEEEAASPPKRKTPRKPRTPKSAKTPRSGVRRSTRTRA